VKSVVKALVEGGASGIVEIHNLQTSIVLPCIANLSNQIFPCIFKPRLPQKFVEPYELRAPPYIDLWLLGRLGKVRWWCRR
jgi:hypothetical protein